VIREGVRISMDDWIGWRRTECSYTPGNGCSQVKAGAAEHSPRRGSVVYFRCFHSKGGSTDADGKRILT